MRYNIWLGSLRAAADTTLLQDKKITHMLSLGCEPAFVDPAIEHMKILEVDDDPEQPIYPYLPQAV